MAIAYMLYFWVAAWFIGMAFLEHIWWPLLVLIPIWLALDWLNICFMPLAGMSSRS